MKECKYCKSEINKKAKICPNCRKKQGNVIVRGIIIFFGVMIFIAGIASALNDNENESKPNDSGNTTNNEKFTLLEGTKGYSDASNIFYYIEGSIKNNTNQEYNYIQVNFTVYDKDGANLGTCLDNNNNFDANGTWKFKAICSVDNASEVDSFKLKDITDL